MNGRWTIAFVTATAVAVAGVGFDGYRHHERGATHPSTANPKLVDDAFSVAVTTPTGGMLVQGGTQSFVVAAQSPHGVRTIELWDGNRRVDSQPGVPSGGGQTVADFTYPALDVGPHLLYARVIDDVGAVSISAISNVDVDQARIGRLISAPKGAVSPTGPSPARIPLRAGETAASIAARLSIPTSDVSILNGSALITTHAPTVQPLTGHTLQIAPTPTLTVAGESGALAAVASGCGVTFTGGPAGAGLAEASANQPGLLKVGTLDSHGSASVPELTPGSHLFLAHTAQGDSVPVSVLVPQSCALELGWTGNITLIDGILTLNQNYRNAYLYLQDGAGRPYLRFPASQDAYLPSGVRRINLGSQAQLYGDKTVHVEVWSQQGRTAKQVAEGSYVHKGLQAPSDLTFPPAPITLSSSLINLGGQQDQGVVELPGQSPINLYWSTTNPKVTRVEWQVTMHADINVGDGRPADTVFDGFSYPSETGNGTERGTITIDPRAVQGLAPGSALPQGTTGAALQDQLRTSGGQVYVRAVGRGSTAGTGAPPISIYLGLVSNTIPMTLLSPEHQSDQFQVTSLTLDNGAYPNPAYEDCVAVSNIHWTSAQRQAAHEAGNFSHFTSVDYLVLTYPADGRYCFSPPSNDCGFFCAVGQFFGTLLSGLEDAWDFIANTFNGLISDVAQLAADLNPVCAIIGAAGSSAGKQDCKTITAIVAHAAISAVLAAYGIPPSLPTSAQIGKIAHGDLTELAETYLEELGVPCDDATVSGAEATALAKASSEAGVNVQPDADGTIDACAVAINALLGLVEGAVSQKAQDDVATLDYAPPCPIDECTIKQDPTGYVQPPLVHIQAVRVGGVAKPGQTIPVNVTFTSSDPDHWPPTYLGGSVLLVSADGSTIDETFSFTTVGPYGHFDVSALDPFTITAHLAMVTSVYGEQSAYLKGPNTATAGYAPMAP